MNIIGTFSIYFFDLFLTSCGLAVILQWSYSGLAVVLKLSCSGLLSRSWTKYDFGLVCSRKS